MKPPGTSGLLSLIVVLLASCSDTPPSAVHMQTNALGAELLVSPPQVLIETRAVNINLLDVIVSIDRVPIENQPVRQAGSEQWVAQTRIPEGSEVLLSVEWVEDYRGTNILGLAYWERRVTIASDLNIQIADSEYITRPTDGISTTLNLDNDDDGFSNLDERRADSNPLDAESTPESIPSVNVIIPVTAGRSPDIDGRYQSAEYEFQPVQDSDTSGELLYIDNLMLGESEGTANVLPQRGDGNTEMRWLAIHDDENLYITVFGEYVELSTTFGDSAEAWNDDNLNIFLDTDNSAGTFYDGENDFHILIPLLNIDGSANAFDGPEPRIALGTYSASLRLSDIEFATCGDACGSGTSQRFWEVKIPFASVGLAKNRVFGLDVQLDIDHDGGDRDAKWGWFHPAGFDSTWQIPARMGKGYLQ